METTPDGAMDERDIAHLLAAAARGDEEAFPALYAATVPVLFALSVRMLGRRDAAEDALAEAYSTIWRHAGGFQASGVRPLTFMGAIVRNVCAERLRSDDPHALTSAVRAAARAERTDRYREDDGARRLGACLARMDPAAARLVRAAYFKGVTRTAVVARDGADGAHRADHVVTRLAQALSGTTASPDDDARRGEAAASYVIGLMDGDARRQFEARMLGDAALTALVWRIEERLRPLVDALPSRRPPRRLAQRVQARVLPHAARRSREAAATRWGSSVVRSLILLAALAVVAAIPLVIAAVWQPDAVWPD